MFIEAGLGGPYFFRNEFSERLEDLNELVIGHDIISSLLKPFDQPVGELESRARS
jgi:hypothetical protein